MELAVDERLEQEGSSTSTPSGKASRSPEELANIVTRFASSGEWLDRVRLRADSRWYERLYQDTGYDIWVISWLPGQSTGFHDHGTSSGAFVVATGTLEEHRPGEEAIQVHSGEARAFGSDYAHDVRNGSTAPAISIHAYSPPLEEMNEYELDGSRLIPRQRALGKIDTLNKEWSIQSPNSIDLVNPDRPSPQSIEQVLTATRTRLRRLSPLDAYEAIIKAEAVLVDIRPEGQRAIEGEIAGALVVERNVLEWRFDPASSARLPIATNHDIQVIVVCSEGYTSSLAASALQDLGLWRATDIVGGFHAWRAAGLPTT